MSLEVAPKPETPSSRFNSQVIETYQDLIGHAVWNVGMPYETPLRWYFERFQGEVGPRSHQLWIKLNEKAFIYLTKTLRTVDISDGSWSVTAHEDSEEEGIDYTVISATIMPNGRVQKSMGKYLYDKNKQPGTYVGGDSDLSKRQRAKMLPHLTKLLKQARQTMPRIQQEFMQGISESDFRIAATMQLLGDMSLADQAQITRV